MPNPQKHLAGTSTIEPSRLRLILQRLQDRFYDRDPAASDIAAAVLADLKDPEESPSARPH